MDHTDLFNKHLKAAIYNKNKVENNKPQINFNNFKKEGFKKGNPI